jgi:hypothetical protein
MGSTPTAMIFLLIYSGTDNCDFSTRGKCRLNAFTAPKHAFHCLFRNGVRAFSTSTASLSNAHVRILEEAPAHALRLM